MDNIIHKVLTLLMLIGGTFLFVQSLGILLDYSGVKKFLPYVDKARKLGMRIAVVWRYKWQIPKKFMGMEVISGDEHDARFIEPHGVVSALYAKGDAIHDNSGFVVG